MLTITPDKLASDTRQELLRAERRIADATVELRRREGERDRVLERLTDLDGAHLGRFVPVR